MKCAESIIYFFQKLQEILSTSWKDNEGQSCAGLSWERFTNVEQAKVRYQKFLLMCTQCVFKGVLLWFRKERRKEGGREKEGVRKEGRKECWKKGCRKEERKK